MVTITPGQEEATQEARADDDGGGGGGGGGGGTDDDPPTAQESMGYDPDEDVETGGGTDRDTTDQTDTDTTTDPSPTAQEALAYDPDEAVETGDEPTAQEALAHDPGEAVETGDEPTAAESMRYRPDEDVRQPSDPDPEQGVETGTTAGGDRVPAAVATQAGQFEQEVIEETPGVNLEQDVRIRYRDGRLQADLSERAQRRVAAAGVRDRATAPGVDAMAYDPSEQMGDFADVQAEDIELTGDGAEVSTEFRRGVAFDRLQAATESDIEESDVVREDGAFGLTDPALAAEAETTAAAELGIGRQYVEATAADGDAGTGFDLSIDENILDTLGRFGSQVPGDIDPRLERAAGATQGPPITAGESIPHPLTQDFQDIQSRGRERFIQGTVDTARGPVDALASGFEQPSDTDIQEQRREEFPDITADLEAGLEEQTDTELDAEDVNIEFDGTDVTGTLSPSGESEVAASGAPLSNVPVVGDVLAQGARTRVGIQQTFRPASEAYQEATPGPEDLGTLVAVGAPAAVAEPTPVGEVTVGGAALGVGALAGTAAAADVATGAPPEAEAGAEADPSDVTIGLEGPAGATDADTADATQFGEIPAPTESPEEPFPGEAPAPTRPASEPFPTEQDAPTTAPSEPFPDEVPEGETPEQPSEPFPEDAPQPEDAQEPFPGDAPTPSPEVGQTVGGPAAFGTPLGTGLVQRGLLEEEDEATTPTIGGEDIVREVPLPGEAGYPGVRERVVEGQRVRTFGEAEPIETAETQYQEGREDLSQLSDAATTQAQTPVGLQDVMPLSRQDQDVDIGQDTAQPQQQGQVQEPVQVQQPGLVQQQVTTPGYGYPQEPGYPEEPGYPFQHGYGTPQPPTGQPRIPFPTPEADDEEDDDPTIAGARRDIFADFRDPLSGDVIETGGSVSDSDLPPWLR